MSSECEKPDQSTIDSVIHSPLLNKRRRDIKLIHQNNDKINHPSHYQGQRFEVIDIIEDFDLGFKLGNAIKYILRAGRKGDFIEDLRKAIWYLEREILHPS